MGRSGIFLLAGALVLSGLGVRSVKASTPEYEYIRKADYRVKVVEAAFWGYKKTLIGARALSSTPDDDSYRKLDHRISRLGGYCKEMKQNSVNPTQGKKFDKASESFDSLEKEIKVYLETYGIERISRDDYLGDLKEKLEHRRSDLTKARERVAKSVKFKKARTQELDRMGARIEKEWDALQAKLKGYRKALKDQDHLYWGPGIVGDTKKDEFKAALKVLDGKFDEFQEAWKDAEREHKAEKKSGK